MPKYSYEILDQATGETISGDVEAESVSDAIAKIDDKGLTIISISQSDLESIVSKTSATEPVIERLVTECVDEKEKVVKPLYAFAAELPNAAMNRQLRSLIRDIESNSSAQSIIKQYPEWIPAVISIRQGHAAPNSMASAVSHATEISETHRRRWQAVIYPLIVLGIAMIVLVSVLWYLVPQMIDMFREFAIRLPTPTLQLAWMSDSLQSSSVLFFISLGLILLAILAITWAIIHEWSFFRLFHFFVTRHRSKLAAISMFSGNLAELLAAGVPLKEALPVLADGTAYPTLRLAIESLAAQSSMGSNEIPNNSAARMIPGDIRWAIESSRPNIPLLHELSSIYRDRYDSIHRPPGAIVSQFAIAAVGLIVAWIVISLFAPMISLIDTLA